MINFDYKCASFSEKEYENMSFLRRTSQKKKEYKAIPAKKNTYAWVTDKNALHGGQYQEVEDCGLLTLGASALALLKGYGVTPDSATLNFSDERALRMDPNGDGLVTGEELQTYYEKELIRDAFDDYVRKHRDAYLAGDTPPEAPYNPSALVPKDFFEPGKSKALTFEEKPKVRYTNIGGDKKDEEEQNIEEGGLDGIFGGERGLGGISGDEGSAGPQTPKPVSGFFVSTLMSEFENDWRTMARIKMKIKMTRGRGLNTGLLQTKKKKLLQKFNKFIDTSKAELALSRRQRKILDKLFQSLANEAFDESKLKDFTTELNASLKKNT